MNPSSIPWGGLLGAALRLGISPREFWQLSLREWQALSAVKKSDFRKADLSQLIDRFPDGGSK